MRQLAERIGVHRSTVYRTVHGLNASAPLPGMVRALAEALGQSPATIASWTGSSFAAGATAYEPPDGTEYLSHRQRDALTLIINSMIAEAERARQRKSMNSRAVVRLAKVAEIPRWKAADILDEILTPEEGADSSVHGSSPTEQPPSELRGSGVDLLSSNRTSEGTDCTCACGAQ